MHKKSTTKNQVAELEFYKDYIAVLIKNGLDSKFYCVFCGTILKIYFGRYGSYVKCSQDHKYAVALEHLGGTTQRSLYFKLTKDFVTIANGCPMCSDRLVLYLGQRSIKLYCVKRCGYFLKNIAKNVWVEAVGLKNAYSSP